MAGCERLNGRPTKRKEPLRMVHLIHALSTHAANPSHDDILFICQLLTGFNMLMRLGELVWPDQTKLQDYRKVTKRTSVTLTQTTFSFTLPGSKTDTIFAGNEILVRKINENHDAHRVFITYLTSRDKLFPYNAELWLRENGQIPTYTWFITRMRKLFPKEIAGHSIRSGGATALAESNIAPHLIMAIGRWSSEAWRIYIRKPPVLLASLVYS